MPDGTVIDARDRFACAQHDHVPAINLQPNVFVLSFVCRCARCGRTVEFKSKEPIRLGQTPRA